MHVPRREGMRALVESARAVQAQEAKGEDAVTHEPLPRPGDERRVRVLLEIEGAPPLLLDGDVLKLDTMIERAARWASAWRRSER